MNKVANNSNFNSVWNIPSAKKENSGKFYSIQKGYSYSGVFTEKFPFGDVNFVFVADNYGQLWQVSPSNFEMLRKHR